MAESKDILLGKIRNGQPLLLGQQVRLTLLLCGPAILAQLASVLLQFIDASMVGSLGANPAASIGLVSTTTWIFMGFAMAASQGFSVQVAHLIGSNDFEGARKVLRQGLTSVIILACSCRSQGRPSPARSAAGWAAALTSRTMRRPIS